MFCGSTVFEDQPVLLLMLILLEGKPAPTAPCGFLQVRFLVLERRSQSSPFAIDVATPGTQSGSDSSRWVSGGELVLDLGRRSESGPFTVCLKPKSKT